MSPMYLGDTPENLSFHILQLLTLSTLPQSIYPFRTPRGSLIWEAFMAPSLPTFLPAISQVAFLGALMVPCAYCSIASNATFQRRTCHCILND